MTHQASKDQAPILVTGGAGFIGSALVRHLRAAGRPVVNADALTYAAVPGALAALERDPGYTFEHADITDAEAMAHLLRAHRPVAIVHLAAESHADRSIDGPAAFGRTNVMGTATLLDAALAYWRGLNADARSAFRFHYAWTNEVYGTLGPTGASNETTAYAPNSPYAASKAGSDHLVGAWQATYGLPTLISNCSNTYGPFQFPEKLIPLVILSALEDRPIPVYGDGAQVRDWLHVDDHARAPRTGVAAGLRVERGLAATVDWYLVNEAWWRPIRECVYAGERPGNGDGGASRRAC